MLRPLKSWLNCSLKVDLQGGDRVKFLLILSIFTGRNFSDVAHFVSPLKKSIFTDESDLR